MSAQRQEKPDKMGQIEANAFFGEVACRIPPKVVHVVERRTGWAGVIGVATTLTLWWLGEIDGTRAIGATTLVLGISIGSVMLEESMTRLFGSLAHAVVSHEPDATSGSASKHSWEREGNTDQR